MTDQAPRTRPGVASLSMYPFPAVEDALDVLWAAIATRLAWVPDHLVRQRDPTTSWLAPDLALGQTCGWPLVTSLRDRVRVVGAFALDVPGARGHCTRSVLIGDGSSTVDELWGSNAAMNAPDSLSGCISLLAARRAGLGQTTAWSWTWPGGVVWTGSHVESVRCVREREAQIASIDPVTWAVLEDHDPDAVAGLAVIGHGPLVPSLPLITAASRTDAELAELRAALGDAFADRRVANVMRSARAVGFVPLDVGAYGPVLQLVDGPAA